MFERDPFGLNPQFPTHTAEGTPSAGRHAIRKQNYLQRKRAKLTAEADERQHQLNKAQDAAAASFVNRVAGSLARFATTFWRTVHGRTTS